MNRYTMRDATARPYRLIALVLLLTFGMEYTESFFARAQVQLDPLLIGTAQSAELSRDIPPIQEVERTEEREPFYKTWWFWTLVGLVVVGGIAATAAVLAANDPPSPGLGSAAQP